MIPIELCHIWQRRFGHTGGCALTWGVCLVASIQYVLTRFTILSVVLNLRWTWEISCPDDEQCSNWMFVIMQDALYVYSIWNIQLNAYRRPPWNQREGGLKRGVVSHTRFDKHTHVGTVWEFYTIFIHLNAHALIVAPLPLSLSWRFWYSLYKPER